MRAYCIGSVMLVGAAAAPAACDDPGVSIEITDARTGRDPDGTVAVEVDLKAHEQLGNNLGIYCVRVTFDPEAPAFHEVCKSDLKDGDTETVRLVSTQTTLIAGKAIHIRVRLAAVDVGEDLAVPK